MDMKTAYKWDCGCEIDDKGELWTCGIPHTNLVTELLNEEQKKYKQLEQDK